MTSVPAAFDKDTGTAATGYPGSKTRRFAVLKPGDAKTATAYTLRTDLTPVLWQPDCDAPFCIGCKKSFGFFVGRHHCRSCGLCLETDCAPIREEYNDERVCIFCVRALEQLNLQAEKEVERRLQAGADAVVKLAAILPEIMRSRHDIIQTEEAVRAELIEKVRADRIKVGQDIKKRIHDVVGEVPEIMRRRVKPIFGIRGGVLTIRVQRLRNLQPVKPYNTCTPFVYADVGHETKRSTETDEPPEIASMTHLGLTSASALDFVLCDTFVFDVEDDRTGILLWVVDECSLPGVPVFLGITCINIRAQGLLLEEPQNLDADIREAVEPYVRAPTQQDLEAADAQLQRDKQQFLNSRQKTLIESSGRDVHGVAAAARSAEANKAAIAAALAAERLFSGNSAGGGAVGRSGIGATPGQLAAVNANKKRARAVDDIHLHHADDFLPHVEVGAMDVPLYDPRGKPINHCSIRVLWTLHPLRQDTKSVAARALMCSGCKQRDMPGFCSCDYDKKDRIDEKAIEERMREKAKELQQLEFAQRKKRGHEYSEIAVVEEKSRCCC